MLFPLASLLQNTSNGHFQYNIIKSYTLANENLNWSYDSQDLVQRKITFLYFCQIYYTVE